MVGWMAIWLGCFRSCDHTANVIYWAVKGFLSRPHLTTEPPDPGLIPPDPCGRLKTGGLEGLEVGKLEVGKLEVRKVEV